MIHPTNYTDSGDLVFANVWHALCDTHEQAAEMTMRCDLLNPIMLEVKRRQLSRARLCKLLGINPVQANNLRVGNVGAFDIPKLLSFCVRLDLAVSVHVT